MSLGVWSISNCPWFVLFKQFVEETLWGNDKLSSSRGLVCIGTCHAPATTVGICWICFIHGFWSRCWATYLCCAAKVWRILKKPVQELGLKVKLQHCLIRPSMLTPQQNTAVFETKFDPTRQSQPMPGCSNLAAQAKRLGIQHGWAGRTRFKTSVVVQTITFRNTMIQV